MPHPRKRLMERWKNTMEWAKGLRDVKGVARLEKELTIRARLGRRLSRQSERVVRLQQLKETFNELVARRRELKQEMNQRGVPAILIGERTARSPGPATLQEEVIKVCAAWFEKQRAGTSTPTNETNLNLAIESRDRKHLGYASIEFNGKQYEIKIAFNHLQTIDYIIRKYRINPRLLNQGVIALHGYMTPEIVDKYAKLVAPISKNGDWANFAQSMYWYREQFGKEDLAGNRLLRSFYEELGDSKQLNSYLPKREQKKRNAK